MPTEAGWRLAFGPYRRMIDAVNTLRNSDLQHLLRPTCDAVKDRRDGLPTGASWAKPVRVGRPCGVPLGFQDLTYQRLPRPFVWGGNAQRTLFRAPTVRNPGAPQRGGPTGEPKRAREPSSWGRGERFRSVDPRRMLPTMVLGPTTPRQQPGVPGLDRQVLACVYGSDISTWRGLVHALVEAEDMPLDVLPRDALPGRHQGLLILCVGS